MCTRIGRSMDKIPPFILNILFIMSLVIPPLIFTIVQMTQDKIDLQVLRALYIIHTFIHLTLQPYIYFSNSQIGSNPADNQITDEVDEKAKSVGCAMYLYLFPLMAVGIFIFCSQEETTVSSLNSNESKFSRGRNRFDFCLIVLIWFGLQLLSSAYSFEYLKNYVIKMRSGRTLSNVGEI